MLRVAPSRVGPLALRLREGIHYFQTWAHLLWGAGAGKRYYIFNKMIQLIHTEWLSTFMIGRPSLGYRDCSQLNLNLREQPEIHVFYTGT